jgi:mRNA degradation ribonuclease J1/J2
MPTEIRQVISKIKPSKMYPIHTEHPELFSRFVAGVTNVELPTMGKTYEL